MISVLPRHIPLRGVSHCCHGCLQYTAIISPDTHTRSGRLHSSHPPRSSPARLPAALHLAIRSGVLGRCPLHHHPHSHPGETREKRPQEPPSTHTTRGTPGFLPGSPPGDKPGFVTSPGFSQGYGKCGFLVFSRVALWCPGNPGVYPSPRTTNSTHSSELPRSLWSTPGVSPNSRVHIPVTLGPPQGPL